MHFEIKTAAILPCYNSKGHVLSVLEKFGPEIDAIYCVDDACPAQTGLFIKENCNDPRVKVILSAQNQGVGGATMTGMTAACQDGASVLIKVDSDGQMDPRLIPQLIGPILRGEADFCKGNRFHDLNNVRSMPKVRLFGNAVLSFMTKLSSGYWDMFDPTNGFVALHASIYRRLNLKNITNRYFFESDLLFRVGLVQARVLDMPMVAVYGEEESGLKISRIIGTFIFKHIKNFFKRIAYTYFIRDFNAGTLYLLLSVILLLLGSVLGIRYLVETWMTDVATTSGQVMISTLPLFVGFQLGIAFLTYDIENTPKHAKWTSLEVQDRLIHE